jgi:hypothetical protein
VVENEIKPIKIYSVKTWDIRLKSGAVATYNIREDLGEYFQEVDGWWAWQWPAQRRYSRIRDEDIAAEDYAEVEMKELKAYKPKKGSHAEEKDPAARKDS